jgi:hypothetical protein
MIFAIFSAVAKMNSKVFLADSLAGSGTSVALSAASTAESGVSVARWTASLTLDLLAARRMSTLLMK